MDKLPNLPIQQTPGSGSRGSNRPASNVKQLPKFVPEMWRNGKHPPLPPYDGPPPKPLVPPGSK
jgi:hypothetical protein